MFFEVRLFLEEGIATPAALEETMRQIGFEPLVVDTPGLLFRSTPSALTAGEMASVVRSTLLGAALPADAELRQVAGVLRFRIAQPGAAAAPPPPTLSASADAAEWLLPAKLRLPADDATAAELPGPRGAADLAQVPAAGELPAFETPWQEAATRPPYTHAPPGTTGLPGTTWLPGRSLSESSAKRRAALAAERLATLRKKPRRFD